MPRKEADKWKTLLFSTKTIIFSPGVEPVVKHLAIGHDQIDAWKDKESGDNFKVLQVNIFIQDPKVDQWLKHCHSWSTYLFSCQRSSNKI